MAAKANKAFPNPALHWQPCTSIRQMIAWDGVQLLGNGHVVGRDNLSFTLLVFHGLATYEALFAGSVKLSNQRFAVPIYLQYDLAYELSGGRIVQDCGNVDPDCTAAAQDKDLIKHQAERVSSGNVQDFLRADEITAESYEAYESETRKGQNMVVLSLRGMDVAIWTMSTRRRHCDRVFSED